jgi:hypothetical protein
MKIFILASVLGALTFSAMAQSTSNETVTISGAKAEKVQQNRTMDPDEFANFTGSYELSNGNSLALFSRGLKKYAAVHGEVRHEIVATSSNSFVAVDKHLQMKIERNANGEIRGELLIFASPDQVAGNGATTQVVRLALH